MQCRIHPESLPLLMFCSVVVSGFQTPTKLFPRSLQALARCNRLGKSFANSFGQR
jgi:hypothetical protein